MADGIAWPLAATVGHLSVSSNILHGHFPAAAGLDARLCCEIVPAGKYRNGAPRSWCRSHQHYWGVKADLADLDLHGTRRCARHDDALGYVLDPIRLKLAEPAPTALAASSAIAVELDPAVTIFSTPEIVQVNLTPPAVLALTTARDKHLPLGCSDCARCRHPHLDLGAFAQRPHQRHTCGHCGYDASHSGMAMVSTPLYPLLQRYPDHMRVALLSMQRFLVL